jgi:hypothetical protein
MTMRNRKHSENACAFSHFMCALCYGPYHVTDISPALRLLQPAIQYSYYAAYLVMSPPDSHSPTPGPITPPRPRSSNKALSSPLRPNSAPQPSNSQRPTITPTTSPRPAIGPAVSPATPPPERSKTRAMDLLREHYGLSVTPPPPSGRPMDPMDLGQPSLRNITRPTNKAADSPAFDAKAYYDQLITTSSLTTLLKKENELLTGEL